MAADGLQGQRWPSQQKFHGGHACDSSVPGSSWDRAGLEKAKGSAPAPEMPLRALGHRDRDEA